MSLSARMIGEIIGKSSREVNQLLYEHGLLQGGPGEWSLTTSGESYGHMSYHDNGYGGYAARSWEYVMWDESVLDIIAHKDTSSWICTECGADLTEQDERTVYRNHWVCRNCYCSNQR